ncbi:WD domain, G-beta repeat protein [Cooperia oncophora]
MNAEESNEFKKVRVFASLPRTVRGFPTVIGSSPKGDKIIYCNGNSVFIVDVEDVTNVDIYTEHPVATTVAKMSPSGFYIASGDSAGNVRIWDTTQITHILKATYQVFSGSVRDIAWNDDSKRIAAVGEGRERFGHVFLFDTGTSNGNLSGQSRPMSSIDFRPARPYRLVSGSEDNTVAIFEGPPFKFKTTFHEHSRFVHVTRYSPDGSLFASAGADGKGGAAHAGSVFGLAWSPCGQKIATASGDKTVKIWNVPEKSLTKVVTFGDSTEDQQIGISWSPKALVSVSLAGFLNFIDPEGNITRVVHGHNKGITTLALSSCKQWLITADFEGHISRWNISNGESIRVQPALHKSQVVGLTTGKDEVVISCAWDDTVRFTRGVMGSPDSIQSSSVNLPSQPQGMASEGHSTVIACYKNILVFEVGGLLRRGKDVHS